MNKITDRKPWHHQFWPWFLIFLPLVVIVACFYTVFVALDNPLSMVKEDYYKEGLAINQDQQRYQHAESLHISARIYLADEKIRCEFDKGDALENPRNLLLQFIHPVNSKKDIQLLLDDTGTIYQSETLTPEMIFNLLAEKRWYLYLQPHKEQQQKEQQQKEQQQKEQQQKEQQNAEWALRSEGGLSVTDPILLGHL